MPRTTIRSEDVTDAQIKTADVAAGGITTAKMATDPTNASNLSTGSVPAGRLGNVDTSGINANKDDIALLAFQLTSTNDLAKYNLQDQIVDTFQDASGVDASASTLEVRNDTGDYYSGQSSGSDATGGTVTQAGGYTYHSFLTSDDFVSPGDGTVEAVMVAGGGQGGWHHGGGGGAGGIVWDTALTIGGQTYAIVVGDGGSATSSPNTAGATGADSTGFGWIAKGGGGGGYFNGNAGLAGGSGGGAGGYSGQTAGASNQTSAGTGSSGTRTAYGNPGNVCTGPAGGSTTHRGGGASQSQAPNSLAVPAFSSFGVSGAFGGGGGAGGDPQPNTSAGGGAGAGHGGAGGGGAGGAATANTGSGGGGGGGTNGAGGNGGSGWVGVKYTTNSLFSPADMVLVSTANTAQAQPTTADIVMTYTNGLAGTAVINTDLIASVSRDNGTTYTAVTLGTQQTLGGQTVLTAHDIDISGQPAGTAMRWKVATTVQGSTKTTRIHAVSLGWA